MKQCAKKKKKNAIWPAAGTYGKQRWLREAHRNFRITWQTA